jgi:hypothetical protein
VIAARSLAAFLVSERMLSSGFMASCWRVATVLAIAAKAIAVLPLRFKGLDLAFPATPRAA